MPCPPSVPTHPQCPPSVPTLCTHTLCAALKLTRCAHPLSCPQVSLFAGCSRDFYNTLVTKLKPCICVAGDYVFYEVHACPAPYSHLPGCRPSEFKCSKTLRLRTSPPPPTHTHTLPLTNLPQLAPICYPALPPPARLLRGRWATRCIS